MPNLKKIDINDPSAWSLLDWDEQKIPEILKKDDASIARSRSNRLTKKGKKDSSETKERKSKGQTGRKKPDHAAKLSGRKRPEFSKKMKGVQTGELNGNSKTYIITEPGGEQYEIKSLKSFAESLGKPVVTAREMAMGKYPGNTSKRGAWANWIIVEKAKT
jgi:hypothetical protein